MNNPGHRVVGGRGEIDGIRGMLLRPGSPVCAIRRRYSPGKRLREQYRV